jgi:hypothetical protein
MLRAFEAWTVEPEEFVEHIARGCRQHSDAAQGQQC